ncbi:class I SAM-dependent methyltransferase [Nocardiopsis sp. JB363]|uniref:class I SAM-dependent methyltransferase n=1 Tax=Nocardiopsis sp. JB363 TaxID=1434837 RepID=UPI00097B31FB|nr:class I SAM-dependent methyltransferase [Nocardiopsis sp. JB363]SIO87213.1 O-methyl transferase [Nocardiopsis sp. JB363]
MHHPDAGAPTPLLHLPPLPRHRWALNPLTLGPVYDHLVIGRALPRLWGADPYLIDQLYDGNIGPLHLELGTLATGFLAHALDAQRHAVEQVHLLDHDPAPVRVCTRRVRAQGYPPHRHVLDPRHPWPSHVRGLDSVGSTLWTHTLPAAHRDLIFDRVASALAPGGRFFGAAVVGPHDTAADLLTPRARHRRALYNRVGLFANLNDTARIYRHLLTRSFGPTAEVHTRLVGAVVLWEVTTR